MDYENMESCIYLLLKLNSYRAIGISISILFVCDEGLKAEAYKERVIGKLKCLYAYQSE